MLQMFMRLRTDCLEGHSQGCRPLFAPGRIEGAAPPFVAAIGGGLGPAEADDQFPLAAASKGSVNELRRVFDGRSCGGESLANEIREGRGFTQSRPSQSG